MTDNKVQAAKKERDFLEVKVEAAELKKDLARLSKGLGEGSGDDGGMRPIDRVREAYTSGLEIRAFKQALGDGEGESSKSNSSEPSQKTVQEAGDARAKIVESLVKAGKSVDEIEQYLIRLGPHLEMAAIARDPYAAAMLYSRFGNNPKDMQFKDVIETIKLVNDMKGGGNSQGSVAEIATALVEAFKAGKEGAQSANPGMGNFEAFQEGMKFVTPILDKQNDTVKTAYAERIKSLEEKLAGSDPVTYLKQIKETAETLGLGGMDKELELHKLHLEEKQGDRKFEWDLKNWELEKQEKIETRKEKRQSQILDRVFKGVETALESPVIKEAGKMVGGKLEGKLPDVRGQAARSQLQEPLKEVQEFMCPNCRRTTEFTKADLVTIANRGGRWVCPTQGCGKPYILGSGGTAQK